MTTLSELGLPEPKCKWGYTEEQVADIMGDRLNEFRKWNRGSTMVSCWDHHGSITYVEDVANFLRGLAVNPD